MSKAYDVEYFKGWPKEELKIALGYAWRYMDTEEKIRNEAEAVLRAECTDLADRIDVIQDAAHLAGLSALTAENYVREAIRYAARAEEL